MPEKAHPPACYLDLRATHGTGEKLHSQQTDTDLSLVSRGARAAVLLVVGLLLSLPQAAVAAGITVSRAQLSAGQLVVEGSGAVPNAAISIDSVVRGKADGDGAFEIQFTGFSSTSCVITVSDGTSSARATLSGCTST